MTERLYAVGIVAMACLAPQASSAQVIKGTVTDASRRPLQGALVTLVDGAGRTSARFLADRSGRFSLVAPTGGMYAVRAEMLGFEEVEAGPFHVGRGDTVAVRLEADVQPISLDGLVVEAEERCSGTVFDGGAVQRAWDAARTALSSLSTIDAVAPYRFHVVRYQRELNPLTLSVRVETTRTTTAVVRDPFVSRPVEELLEEGFAKKSPNGDQQYFAPDADVLLSDAFLEAHCFHLELGGGEAEGLIGLGFTPRRLGARADIEGELWLDAGDGALRWIDFRYVGLPEGIERLSNAIGGRVDFTQSPDGSWIVTRWHIRMPVVVEAIESFIGQRRLRLTAIVEEGGRVREARRTDSGRLTFAEDVGSIEGTIINGSTEGVVALVGTTLTSSVDQFARFRLEDVPPGRYELAYVRPELLGIDVDLGVGMVDVRAGATSSVQLRVPHVSEVLSLVCKTDGWRPGTGVLLGEIRSDTGFLLRHHAVRVEWYSVDRLDLRGGGAGTIRAIETATNDQGAFRACAVPTDVPLTVSTRSGNSSSEATLSFSSGRSVAFIAIRAPLNDP